MGSLPRNRARARSQARSASALDLIGPGACNGAIAVRRQGTRWRHCESYGTRDGGTAYTI